LSYPFALWRDASHLAQQLRTLIAQAPRTDRLAVTMTGELADCFRDKSEGVTFILNAVQEASDGRPTRVYLITGNMVTPQVAKRKPLAAAAANWHALARFAGRFAPQGPAMLIDVGSTTTDIIPLLDGHPRADGSNDTERLLNRELLYLGVERTPVCGFAQEAPYRGQLCPLAREVFATTRDVYLLLGDLPENLAATDTADGRAATKAAARARLGRMLCVDPDQFNHRDAVTMARALAEQHLSHLVTATSQVLSRCPQPPDSVVLAGTGEFLARRALQQMGLQPQQVSLAQQLGIGVSRCAPAHAVAVLAHEAMAP
jgi:probable H4MPT-linked C1 transfer pathway protein